MYETAGDEGFGFISYTVAVAIREGGDGFALGARNEQGATGREDEVAGCTELFGENVHHITVG